MMTGQQKIMSESGVQVKGLLTTISQHQANSHAAMPSCRAKRIRRLSSEFSHIQFGQQRDDGWKRGEYVQPRRSISYLLEAVKNGKNIVRVISDDTDVFVLLIV